MQQQWQWQVLRKNHIANNCSEKLYIYLGLYPDFDKVVNEEKEIVEVVPEDVVVITTQSGDIKRVASTTFKTQRRNGKGVKNENDAIKE